MALSLSRLARSQLLRLCRKSLESTEFERVLSLPLYHAAVCGSPAMPYSSGKGSKILSHSTILLQDGLDIQELPLVIRRMEAREFPFTTVMYNGESLTKVSEQDESFKMQLKDATTLRQVFSLLEVPGDAVTTYSAAFALQRLCSLQQSREEVLSFVRKAVLNELCETVTREIHTLENDTVIKLLRCYLSSSQYEERFIDKINEDIETRVGDNVFSINDLCLIIDLLSNFPKASQELTNNVWIHLGNRYCELDHNNLPRLFESLRYLPPSQRFLWKLVDKRVMSVWWKLNANDVALLMQRMTLTNHYNRGILGLFGRWLLTNMHDVKDAQLKEILGTYTHFNFSDTNIMKSLERYVVAKVSRMDKSLLALVMEYCRRQRCISPLIFDAVARDFERNGNDYGAPQILNTLRPFGHLNYRPPNTTKLFMTVEDVLNKSFGDFDPASIIELLMSFVYIERFPVNFLKKIFTPHFLAKVKMIPHDSIRQRTGRYLMELQASVVLESPKEYIKPVVGDTFGLSLTWLESRYFKLHISISKILSAVLGSEFYCEVEVPKGTPHIIDFQINIDSNRKPVRAIHDSHDLVETKLALVGLMPEHFCVNTTTLVGEQALKKRHLEMLGHTVIGIPYETFMRKCKKDSDKKAYLHQILSDYIDLVKGKGGL